MKYIKHSACSQFLRPFFSGPSTLLRAEFGDISSVLKALLTLFLYVSENARADVEVEDVRQSARLFALPDGCHFLCEVRKHSRRCHVNHHCNVMSQITAFLRRGRDITTATEMPVARFPRVDQIGTPFPAKYSSM